MTCERVSAGSGVWQGQNKASSQAGRCVGQMLWDPCLAAAEEVHVFSQAADQAVGSVLAAGLQSAAQMDLHKGGFRF